MSRKIPKLLSVTILIMFSVLLLRPDYLHADVPWIDEGPIYSQIIYTSEFLVSFEKGFPRKFSLLAWGGGAFVCTPPRGDFNHTIGFEVAVESRYYPLSSDFKSLFVGVYGGFGRMFSPIDYVYREIEYPGTYGFSYGVKLGYKYAFFTALEGPLSLRFILEPYTSFSFPHYRKAEEGYYYRSYPEEDEGFHSIGPISTYGLRIVFEGILLPE